MLPAITLVIGKKGFMSGKTPIPLAVIGRSANLGTDSHLEFSAHTVTSTACLCLKKISINCNNSLDLWLYMETATVHGLKKGKKKKKGGI